LLFSGLIPSGFGQSEKYPAPKMYPPMMVCLPYHAASADIANEDRSIKVPHY
jgi:hypothetical protein